MEESQLVRIVNCNGTSNGVTNGRYEIFVNGRWNAVLENLPHAAGSVVCKTLGYDNGLQVPSEQPRADGVNVGIEYIDCTGEEDSIFDCQFYWMKDYYERNPRRVGYPIPDYSYETVNCLGGMHADSCCCHPLGPAGICYEGIIKGIPGC